MMDSSVQELKSRLVEAWHKHVMGCSQNRKTFAGAAFMSPGLTTLNLRKMEPEQQALLRAALNGTFYTADRLEHRNGNQSTVDFAMLRTAKLTAVGCVHTSNSADNTWQRSR